MARSHVVEEVFEELDANRDGKIDKNELRNWIAKDEGLTSSSYETSTYGHDLHSNNTSRHDRHKYKETTTATSSLINDTVITTNSSEETKRYLERFGNSIYIDPNPQIIRRATAERPQTFEQRVFIRCLQPPPLPSMEPLIVKEVRPEQPPPLPPLVIREQTPYATSQPPIIFRERPPTPPVIRGSGEIVTRLLPALPPPPRSLVIERFPPAPEKPRDIIIERWIPYGAQSERRTIVQPAAPPIKYPAPTHSVIVYVDVQSNIVRKFERLGVTQEDPDAYVARYGSSLLDSATLLQQARNAGVTEDISCPLHLSSTNATTRGRIVDTHQTSDVGNHGSSSSGAFSYERLQRAADTEATNIGSSSYSLSASHCLDNSTSTGSIRKSRSGVHIGDFGLTVTNTKRDGELNQIESHRHF